MTTSEAAAGTPRSDAPDFLTAGRFSFLLALVFVAAFPGVFAGTETFFRSDFGVMGHPAVHHLRESLRAGELPLWNPLSNCGAPFLAQWGTMCLYPGSLLLVLLPLPWVLGVFSLGHLWLGGLGMFVLARRWTGNSPAAAFAGFAFAFNGATLACLVWPNYCVALGWMPWVVLTGASAWREGGRTIPLAALAGAMQMLAGTPELVLLTWALLTVLLLADWFEKTDSRSRFEAAGRFLGVVFLIAGLSAAQLLPFFDLLEHSQRDASFRDARWPMPVWGWANLFVPLFHYGRTDQGLLVQQGQYFLTSYHLGLVPLALAAYAVWRVRNPQVRILAVLTMLSLMLALGDAGGLYALLKALAPGGGLARYPIKFVLLCAFTVPLLAAWGIHHLQTGRRSTDERLPSRQRMREFLPVFAGVGAVAVLLLVPAHAFRNPLDLFPEVRHNVAVRLLFSGLLVFALLKACHAEIAGRLRRAYFLVTLVLLATDLLTHLPNQNPRIPAKLVAPDQLQPLWEGGPVPIHGSARVMIAPATDEWLNRSLTPQWDADYARKRLNAWSHLNLLDGVAKVNGSSTLRLRAQDELQRRLYPPAITNAPAAEGLKDFLGVAWMSSTNGATVWTNRLTAMPLVTAGQRAVVIADAEERLAYLLSDEFSPREVVVLSGPLSEAGTKPAKAGVKLLHASAHRLVAEITSDQPTWAVIAQTHHHTWRATVNGQPVRIHPANHAFQAVEIPAGVTELQLTYRDANFRNGTIVSLVVVLVCAVWLALTWKGDSRERDC